MLAVSKAATTCVVQVIAQVTDTSKKYPLQQVCVLSAFTQASFFPGILPCDHTQAALLLDPGKALRCLCTSHPHKVRHLPTAETVKFAALGHNGCACLLLLPTTVFASRLQSSSAIHASTIICAFHASAADDSTACIDRREIYRCECKQLRSVVSMQVLCSSSHCKVMSVNPTP